MYTIRAGALVPLEELTNIAIRVVCLLSSVSRLLTFRLVALILVCFLSTVSKL